MVNYIILLVGTIFSCVINIVIVFQFIEERNERIYENRLLYFILRIGICIFMVIINLLNHPIINLICWIIMFSVVNLKLYDNTSKKRIAKILEIPVLILILSVSETVGIVLLEFIIWKFDIHNIQPIMMDSMGITFSKLVVLLIYYLIITKLWTDNYTIKFTRIQCLIEVIIILFSIANLAVIICVISKVTSRTEYILLAINMGCILFADLYILYFARFAEENNQLKVKVKNLEQQSLLQYEYYAGQEEKYNESIKILHDVNKHLKMLENIYQAKQDEMSVSYAQEISKMLVPLAMEQYTNNPILNVLLNDKKKIAKYHNIKFELDVGNVDLSFMEPVEVTTIFGNLLDNAIEACNRISDDRFINMKLDRYNEFVVVNICNSTLPIEKWHLGKPVSKKGKNHGIGLLNVENVVRKYNGNIVLEEKDKKFCCKIIFNK